MRYLLLFVALVAGACHPIETAETDPICTCDCPDGAPEPPELDAFCAVPENDGEACCRGVLPPGTCLRRECVAEGR